MRTIFIFDHSYPQTIILLLVARYSQFTLFGVDIFEEVFVNGLQDVESSQWHSGSTDQQHVKFPTKFKCLLNSRCPLSVYGIYN